MIADRSEFLEAFGGIYEHSPWVAERAFARGGAGLDGRALHALMQRIVAEAAPAEQLELLRAHPELGAERVGLTDYSKSEQHDAGLTHCADEEAQELAVLNAAYRAKFGFPFVIAVAGLTPAQIVAHLRRRLQANRDDEFARGLDEVNKIALIRLSARI